MITAQMMWWAMGAILVLYVLTGGADFGGGVWDLLARKEERSVVRGHIERAIGPIWEANHVWLIFLIVVSFTVFPRAYSVVSVAFHLPLLVALLGIILRGSSFVFRSYGMWNRDAQRGWGIVFGIGSVVTPVALGMTLAGMSSGQVQVSGRMVTSAPTAGWTSPFAFVVGLFALALFSLLAAAHLAGRAHRQGDKNLARYFERRVVVAEAVAGLLAAVALWRANVDAPLLFDGLWDRAWTLPLHIATAAAALVVLAGVFTKRPLLMRAAAMVQVALVVIGWGAAMNGAIVLGAVTLENAGTRPETLDAVALPLVVGSALLVPALIWLFSVFERPARPRAEPAHDDAR